MTETELQEYICECVTMIVKYQDALLIVTPEDKPYFQSQLEMWEANLVNTNTQLQELE